MKKIFVLTVMLAMVLGFSMQARADLNLLGQGTSTHGTYNLIYDTDLDVTWYDYSPFGQWQTMVDWADALSVSFGGNVFEDWRLPTTVDGLRVHTFDGTTTAGYNITATTSEMSHLWYAELENIGYYATDGSTPQPGWGLINTGDFQNLTDRNYWYGTEYSAQTAYAWYFHAGYGSQDIQTKQDSYVIAVMPGMAVVPEPISSTLFLIGGATLGFRRFRKKFKK